MSDLDKYLKISPPCLTPNSKTGEVFTSYGHFCPYCGGIGRLNRNANFPDEDEIKTCDVCRGSGVLNAKIIIGWQPGKKV